MTKKTINDSPVGRVINLKRLIREREILRSCVENKCEFDTKVTEVENKKKLTNLISQDSLGLFRSTKDRKAVIADMKLIDDFRKKGLKVPSFLEAGPRKHLHFDPQKVHAAIVTTGGLAPGLHCVIYSIVKRHLQYLLSQEEGKIYGVYNSYRGLCNLADNLVELDLRKTEEWLDQGGSKLGIVRYFHGGEQGDEAIKEMVKVISKNLKSNNIDILYVLGGDGSLKVAHQIALENPTRSIVGIPKTMDNDVLWVWQSFGFNTAVEQATRVINTLRSEAEATRRIGIIELFGADSGFVAANSTLASGHVDLVLIPEVFDLNHETDCEKYLQACVAHVRMKVSERDRPYFRSPHALVVIAEGVATVLSRKEKGVFLNGVKVEKNEEKDNFVDLFEQLIKEKVRDAHDQQVKTFVNRPGHYIRALPANPHDQIYCERLGALAVDNALAGYTDFMMSKWLTEFVLVPLSLVESGQKSIPIHGMFWKQVVSSTGQPLSAAEQIKT